MPADLYDTRDPASRADGITAAVDVVERGGLVVFPTDTVYGLGANAFERSAVTDLLAAKGRGRSMPPPVLVGSVHTIDGLTFGLPQAGRDLIEAFWPGGLTLIVTEAPSLSWDLGDTRGTVAVRMPLHPVALEILARTGPMAVSSANLTGKPVVADGAEAMTELGESAEVILDAGRLGESLPSSIVDLTGDLPRLVRAGAVGLDALREVVPDWVEPE